ncbi:MAG TPA: ABC transporter transmembrane domain-containing protein [Candidatus Sulfotelmatobacter sp.]|nr:ABC transporter transmembrane domain-containing protein [Candidatus Sulfotelmatobacter sp.]
MSDKRSAHSRSASATALMYRLVRDRVRPHAGTLILSACFMGIAAATTGAAAWLMQPALDLIFVKHQPEMLWAIPAAIIAVYVLKGFSTYGQSMTMNHVAQRIMADTQVDLFAHLMRADIGWLHKNHTGQLVSRFLYDATLLRTAVSSALTGMVKDSLSLVFLAIVMFIQDWRLSFVVVFVFPAAGVLVRKFGKRSRKGSAATQEESGRLTSLLTEAFESARLIKAYGMEAREVGRVRASIDRRFKYVMKTIGARSASTPATEALGGIAVALAIIYGGWQSSLGHMTLGQFASFISALLLAYQPMKSLSSLGPSLQEGLAAADRLFALFDIEPAIKDRPGARPLAVQGGTVRFEAVDFSYAEDAPALHGVSFTAAAGRKIALVGPSGAGKSTILNLIPRFYDAARGAITIDGQDVREVTLGSLRAAIALVSQEARLFDDTVRANILYGRADASEAEIVAAAEAAAAHEFITALPQGYDTIVGENGVKLSGGQRQRIAIARAMLKNAPILLLDEATSALDAESERLVQAALRRLMLGRTTVVIAHRLSTVIDADEIQVIEQGRIVDSGRHGELLARGGTYARLYATQFTDPEPAAAAQPLAARARA